MARSHEQAQGHRHVATLIVQLLEVRAFLIIEVLDASKLAHCDNHIAVFIGYVDASKLEFNQHVPHKSVPGTLRFLLLVALDLKLIILMVYLKGIDSIHVFKIEWIGFSLEWEVNVDISLGLLLDFLKEFLQVLWLCFLHALRDDYLELCEGDLLDRHELGLQADHIERLECWVAWAGSHHVLKQLGLESISANSLVL